MTEMTIDRPNGTPRIVIIGCGFGGLFAAQALAGACVAVTVIDRANHHLFQPLLYQVATAGLSATAIAAPIRHVLRRQSNPLVLMAEVLAIDGGRRVVVLEDGTEVAYHYLIVASGAAHSYFGHDEWAPCAPGLKTLDDALEIRRRVLVAYERAERETADARRAPWLTFVVIGAGATGVEMAGTLAEIARLTLRDEFRRFDSRAARVILLEAGERVLPAYPADLTEKLIALAEHPSEAGSGVSVSRFWKQGAVDYKQVPQLEGVDLDAYRKDGSIEVKVSVGK